MNKIKDLYKVMSETKIITEQVARRNYMFCEETIELKGSIENKFLELGKRLYDIREENKFMPNYETFEDFCMELKMSPATVSKLVNIYQKFVLTYCLDPQLVANAGGWSVVAEVLPMVTSKTTAKKWLHLANVLSRNDLRKEIKEKTTGIIQYECKHEHTYLIRICKDCGERQRVYEDDETKK